MARASRRKWLRNSEERFATGERNGPVDHFERRTPRAWASGTEGGSMKVHGSCHCGAIAYEAEVDPARVVICHCVDCQTLSGAAIRASVPAPAEDFRLLRG